MVQSSLMGIQTSPRIASKRVPVQHRPVPLVLRKNAEKNQDDLARTYAEECNDADGVQDVLALVVDEIHGTAPEAPRERPEAPTFWISADQAATAQRSDETHDSITSSNSAQVYHAERYSCPNRGPRSRGWPSSRKILNTTQTTRAPKSEPRSRTI